MTDDEELAALNAQLEGNNDDKELAELNAQLRAGNAQSRDDEELAALNAGLSGNSDDAELAALNGEKPKKEDLGFWERKRLELEAKTGNKTSMGELALNKTVGLGIDELSETVDEYSEQRLMKGEEDNPLKMVELARRIGLTQEQIDKVTARADSGKRSIGGFKLAPNADVLKQGFAELAKAKVAERVRTREAAQQRLANAEEQSTMGAIGSGVVDMASMPLKFANKATIGATTMINIGNRTGARHRDTYTLDEDGNPVLVKEGDSGAWALAKGTTGGVAETLVWTKLKKIGGPLLKPVGKAISKIPGAGKLFDAATKGVAGAGEKLAAELGKSEGGRLALKTVDVLGDIEDKIHLGSLPGMVAKTRITEFLDEVVGLNAREGEREKFGEWLGKVTSVEDNVRLLTGLIGFHAITAGVGAYRAHRFNKEFRGTGREEIVGEFIGADRAKKLSNEDLEMMYRIVTSPGLTAEKAGEFLDGLKGDLKAAGEQLQGELARRREVTPEQEEKLDAKIAEYAGGNETIAEKVKADILSKMQDSSAIDMPEMLDEMVAMSAREYEPEARRMKVHDLRGSGKTEGEKLSGIEELGVTSWEAAEAEGLTEKDRFGRYGGGARRALHISIEGTEKLKAAVKAGEISGEMAEELLTAAQCELGARPAEERAALIDGIIDRAKGDEALARRMIERLEEEDRGGETQRTLDERLDRAAAEAKVDAIKERNPGASDVEARGAAVEPVETEDGRMTTLGEVVGAGERPSTETAEGRPQSALEGVEMAERLKGTKLKAVGGGWMTTEKFPELRVSVSSEGVEAVGLSAEMMAKPENTADVAAVLAQMTRIAKRNGVGVMFPDQASADIAKAIVREVKEQGLAKAQAKLDTRSKLFNLLFKTALGTGVTYDEAGFKEGLAKVSNGRQFIDKHGNIYGFVDGEGGVHFNPVALNFNTPIHEYGHLALEAIKGFNNKLWQRGMDLVKESDYYREIARQSEIEGHEYSYLKGKVDQICDEALATMIGDRGEKLVTEKGLEAPLKAWLKEFWNAFKGAFGLADLSDEQVERMTLAEFADAVNAELLKGGEFGTKKKIPPSERSVRRYDADESSGSNGMLRWKNDRGYLFAIPVDQEKTKPGGKVVFAADDANVTDWIKSRLNGVELRMSKTGKIYVKGRNGLDGELAEIFGRFPKAGQNDGIFDTLAAELGDETWRSATPDKLVEALAKDRANYDKWVEARKSGKTTEQTQLEQHYAEEAAREEAEERERFEKSGMSVIDYVRSRAEEGEPPFDIDWEIARELAHEEAEGRFAARRLIDGRETAVSEGYPLSIRDARDPEKVLKVLSPLVGKSAAQIGEMKLTRISEASVKHLINSEHARQDIRAGGRDRKKLWRGSVAGMSVTDDIVATSSIGTAQAAKHLNADWKKGATFYEAKTRFAVEVENGKYEVYPCKLIVSEINGERQVYDLTEIGTPTPTTSVSPKTATVGGPQRGLTANGGVGASTTKSIPNSVVGAQGGAAKFAVGGIFTGTAADYANRSRQGGVDDGPSVKHIGTGEGSQVYGWGLYGSTVRGVAEGYANPSGKISEVLVNGERHKAVGVYEKVASMLKHGDAKQYIKDTLEAVEEMQRALDESGKSSVMYGVRRIDQKYIDRIKAEIEEARRIIDSGATLAKPGNLYEQTFFTDRAPGDESHLLKWYDAISDANWDRVIAQAEKEGLREKLKGAWWLHFNGDLEHYITDNGNSGDAIYERLSKLLGGPQSASEFLARAGIDGVKYPVDSYGGKGVKDGDEVGWNYVSFRDDNIRVDHKWTDGVAKFSVAVRSLTDGKKNATLRDVDQKRLTAVMRGLGTGELKHPRFTTEEFAASKGTEHEQLWNYILSLESPDVDGGGAQAFNRGKRGAGAQSGDRLGRLRRVATRYGRDPKEVASAIPAVKEVTVNVEEATGAKTRVALGALSGKDLLNIATGITARINATQRNKIVSNAALRKSKINGFSGKEHFAAAANIENLWKHAELLENRADRDGDINIASIKRFASPVFLDNKLAFAYLTAKESIEHGHRIYSIELESLEALSGTLKGHIPPTDNASKIASNSDFGSIVANGAAEVNPRQQSFDVSPSGKGEGKFSAGGQVVGDYVVGPSALGDGKQRYYEVPFDKAVDKIVKNKKPIGNEQVFVSETPKVFADIGFARLPIMMTQKHVLTISSDAAALKSLKIGGNAHDMKAVLKQVPKAIQKPLMVIASETRPDSSVVAITQLKDRDGKTVIVPIALDGISPIGNGGLIDSHIITSAYGKGNVWSKLVEDAIAKETNGEVGVFYIDTARANVVRNQLACAASGNSALQWLQLPRGRQNPDFVHSIADEGSPVKGGIVSQTATRQFKNWFGGSKVVDANGEPLKVYRGSEYDPLAQEPGKGVIKPEAYFTADPEYAKRYTGNGGKVQAYYLNIRRPFDIRDPECLADLKKVYPDHEFQKGKSGALDWAEASTIDGEFLKENFGDKYDGIIFDEASDWAPEGNLPKWRGISYVPLDGSAQVKSATDNIGTFDPGNPDVRFHVGKGREDWSWLDEGIFQVKPSLATMAMGEREQKPAGLAAAVEKREALRPWTKKQSPADLAKPIAFDAADMVMFWRAVSGSLRNPHVQKGERIKGRPSAIGLNVGGDRIEIVSKLFGVIDASDVKTLREACKADGFFQNEDPDWAAKRSKASVQAEIDRSNAELDKRTRELFRKRVETGEGGEHYATEVLGHEIGHTLGLLPAGAQLGPIGNAAMTLYKAMEREWKRQISETRKVGDAAKNVKGEITRLIAWWHGQEKMPDYYRKPNEMFAELFGIFLTQPESVHAAAPHAYDACVKIIAGNDKLAAAYRKIAGLKWSGKSNDRVMDEVRKTWEKEAQDQYRKLRQMSRESVSLKRDWFSYALNDRFGPMFNIARRGLAAEKKLLEEAVRTGAMSEAEAKDRLAEKEAEINALKTSLYDWQRQSGGQTRLMIAEFDEVRDAAERDGTSWNDVRDYAHLMRVIELGGRATAHGMDPARASATLEDMQKRMGAAAFANVEKTWKAFRAVYERSVLEDANVREIFDDATMKLLYENKHYVTMKHRMGVEESAEWQRRIEEYRKGNQDAWDPCIDIQERLHRGFGSGGDGERGFVLHRLEGSFEATEDPLAATIRRAIEIKESAARNHLLKQMSETLRTLGAKGVYDTAIEKGAKPRTVDGAVYGKLAYMEGGVRHELIVPKVVYKSFKTENTSFGAFGAAMRFIRNTMTLWNPMFINRAYLVDKSALETNLKGMHKAPIDVLSEAFCIRGIGVPLYLANNYLTRFTPIANTWVGKLLWNENTANHYAHQAQKIARMCYEGKFGERLSEARELREMGETGKAAEIEQNVAIAKEMLRRNVFQSAYEFNREQAGFDTDAIMQQFGYRIDGGKDPATWHGRVWAKTKAAGRWWNRFEEEQEAVTKIIAYLYEMKKGGDADAVARTVIEQGGTPNLAARGIFASYIENATGFFWNVRKEGALRTVRALKDHPTEWICKNLAQTALPALLKGLMVTGGLEVLIRSLFDDDDEKVKRSWWAPAVIEHARFMNAAMKCVPGYYQRNYNIIPLAKFGDHVLSMRVKYSPEEFAIQNAIHTAFQMFGKDPTDPDADWSTLASGIWSEFLPDIFGRNYALDAVGTIVGPLLGVNPYDNYRQRNIYDDATWKTRWDKPGHMLQEIGKNFWNYSPLGTFTATFKNGQERRLEDTDVPAWLDRVLATPVVSRIPASMLTITSSDTYVKALGRVDQKRRAYAKLVAQDILADCIANGRLGGFDDALKDLPPELRVITIRHVINGWRQYHMDPAAKTLKRMRAIKDPHLKARARQWIEDGMKDD